MLYSNSELEVIQSYAIAGFKRKIGLYGERILLRLTQLAYMSILQEFPDYDFHSKTPPQLKLENSPMPGYSIKHIKGDKWNYLHIQIPAHDIMPPNDTTHYSVDLQDIRAFFNLDIVKPGSTEKKFEMMHLVNDLSADENTIFLSIREEIWNQILNFSKGYRLLHLEKALSLRSQYSVRFYELLAGQTKKFKLSIDNLKHLFSLENKYMNKNSDFIKYIIEPAKKELDKTTPYSFDYELVKSDENKRGRKQYSHIVFSPKYIPENDIDNKTAKITSITSETSLSPNIIEKLKTNYLLSEEDIHRNLAFLEKINKTINLEYILEQILPFANKADDKKRYLFASLRQLYEPLETNQQTNK